MTSLLNKKSGSILGGTLLIAGSCIGAGMLALPVITGPGGFLPSLFLFFCAWLFMTTTGFLLMEANLTLGHRLSLVSLAEKSLGRVGKGCAWILFLFLFYSLSIAYIGESGSILQLILFDVTGVYCPDWGGSLFFTLVFGFFLLIGTRHVDYLNRLLMIGLIATYCALIFLGSRHVQGPYLAHRHWIASFAALPILVISFGFHNMIPSLAMYFEGDVKRLRLTLLFGSLLPLLIYFLWQLVLLGIIPPQETVVGIEEGEGATELLRTVVGRSWVNTVAQAFALFAIITSFLAQSLSLVDFLADGLKVTKAGLGRFFLVLLTLAPPFILAFLYPAIFIHALNLAGGISAVLLFGVMPALMVWRLHRRKGVTLSPLLPVKQGILIAVLLISFLIFALELAQEFGWSLLPSTVGVT